MTVFKQSFAELLSVNHSKCCDGNSCGTLRYPQFFLGWVKKIEIKAGIGATFMDPHKLLNDFMVFKRFQCVIEVEPADFGWV